ncbi:hypothetical protein SAM23877_6588 [Streptomyces ambofaciens ATCC 23877]|uniref:Uncharacterized protein n=2 Tax=Streptomyces ambofaciens TaxID=1889 RepID=A0ADY7_STRA7|nr:hypothetical protein [Streptomyces ambofaciens]AKZ59633.1 hypothetical protein SAM23877_6588 [Streptomyces ambofaciens ATCC 23877]ANB09881.1 hypothetical protein SAM40697_5928 [Streptomyces ambofaciens]CAJ88694.1 conserved hypothetical protein [Streptomyces ambofaciens ATCC 23877]
MELRSVEELMDLLYACRGEGAFAERGSGRVDLHEHALRTAALLRRRRPADKELQVAGLVAPVGRLLRSGDPAGRTADAVRPLLGARVARLLRRHAHPDAWAHDEDLVRLHQAAEEARTTVFDAGVLEDWRTVLELTAARHSRLGAVD